MALLNIAAIAASMHDVESSRISGELSQLHSTVEALAVMSQELDSVDVSVEKLISFMHKIGDSVLQITNTFKALTLAGGKRSELKFWYESHVTSTKAIEGSDSALFEDLMVDIPTGMRGTYAAAVAAIADNYSVMDVEAVLKQGVTVADTILSSMSKGSQGHESLVSANVRILEAKLKNWNAPIGALEKQFSPSGKSLEKKPFKAVVGSVSDLKNTRITLIGFEDNLLKVTRIRNNSDKMNHSINLVVDFIERANEGGADLSYVPSREFLQNLASYASMIALVLENYSAVVTKQLAVEHNLVLTYATLASV